jgi:cob(I)alamin adenosyltransferase
MKIYTKTGDEGETGLFAGPRVWKNDLRIEAYGVVDELNSFLGWGRSQTLPPEIDSILERIQHDLFAVGAELATVDPQRHGMDLIGEEHITVLEQEIDHWEAILPPLREFIIPGGSSASAALHLARCVCRRAERHVVDLRLHQPEISEQVLRYLNRLGDLLFVLARAANHHLGVQDIPWKKPVRCGSRNRPSSG